MLKIESKDNKHFKELKKLIAIEGIKKSGRTIISGKKQVKEIARQFSSSCISLILYDGYAEDDKEINALIKNFSFSGSLYILKKHLYHELDSFNTNAPLLVIHTPSIPEWDYSLAQGCNLLIPFQDPLNVGAVIRSAAGFGVKKIILLREAAHPFHPKSIRASAGTVFKFIHPHPVSLPSPQAGSTTRGRIPNLPSPGGRELKGGGLVRGPSINALKKICNERSLQIISLDMAGTPIESFHFPKKFLLLPGLEGQGLPDELKSSSISIPITDRIESLNAAIAASIALFAWNAMARNRAEVHTHRWASKE